MLKRVFCVNYLVALQKNSLRVVRVDSDRKSMCYYVVIHQLPNLKYFNMYINLHQEVSILQAKVVQPSV